MSPTPPQSPDGSYLPYSSSGDTPLDVRNGAVFAGSGEMRERCRDLDWAATALGPVHTWPQSLRTLAASVLGSAFPMILLWGPDLVQIYNNGYIQFLGAKHPAGLGATTRECWPEVWHINAPIYERVLKRETVAFEDALYPVRRQGPAGPLEDLFITLSYSPALNEAGEVGGVLITLLDTTAQVLGRVAESERVRLAGALAAAPTQILGEVFRQAPSFLAVYNGPEHVFVLVNEAYYQLIGHGRDIIGKPLLEALPEVMGQGFDTLLDRVLRTGEPFVSREIPVTLERMPGASLEDRVVSLTYLPHVNAAGKRVGVIAHGTDVTEYVVARRQVERLLGESESAHAEADTARRVADEACADAEAANRAKSEFLTIMSHELRTPLNAISGHVQLIEMGLHGPVTPKQQEALTRVMRAQYHLLGLINDVLNFAKLASGTVAYDLQPVVLAEVMADAARMTEQQIQGKGLTFGLQLPNRSVIVVADPEKLLQVLINLLSNATKFTPAGGHVRMEAGVRAIEAGATDVVFVCVTDTGDGIAKEKLASVFEPFVQVNATNASRRDGTGLGLSISRDLARGMHGDLQARSTPGVGSSFTVTLPAALNDSAASIDPRGANQSVGARVGTPKELSEGGIPSLE